MVASTVIRGFRVMRIASIVRPASFAAVLAGVLAAGAASAQDLTEPFFGGAYVPGPNYAYGGGGETVVGGGFGPVTYNQGYYMGGPQYPAGGYGGGAYRRAAYSAADVYVGPRSYERAYLVPQTVYRPVVRTEFVPVTAYRVVRKRCNCETLY